jgi:hypothetical protein
MDNYISNSAKTETIWTLLPDLAVLHKEAIMAANILKYDSFSFLKLSSTIWIKLHASKSEQESKSFKDIMVSITTHLNL